MPRFGTNLFCAPTQPNGITVMTIDRADPNKNEGETLMGERTRIHPLFIDNPSLHTPSLGVPTNTLS